MLSTMKRALRPVLLLTAAVLAPAAPVSRAARSRQIHRPALIRHRDWPHHLARQQARSRVGVASFYSNYYNGRPTANGERFSNQALTAASNEWPLGSRVKVTNLTNHRSVTVRVTDRGPFRPGRRIDLSRRAAQQLGFVPAGLTKVRITPLS
jgi:rare lipoprotein A